jgi:CBS domain-containing protein
MEIDKKSIIRAREVMQKAIVTIDGMATAKEAAAKMKKKKNLLSACQQKTSG